MVKQHPNNKPGNLFDGSAGTGQHSTGDGGSYPAQPFRTTGQNTGPVPQPGREAQDFYYPDLPASPGSFRDGLDAVLDRLFGRD